MCEHLLQYWSRVQPVAEESHTIMSLISAHAAQIIHVNLTSADLKPIEATGNVEFTYSVHWSPTDIHFSQRFERYLDQNFFEHQVSPRACRSVHTSRALFMRML